MPTMLPVSHHTAESFPPLPAYSFLEIAIFEEMVFLSEWEAGNITGLFAMLRVRQIRRSPFMTVEKHR